MKNTIIRKLTSRKFWAAVIGFVTAILTVFNVKNITPEQAEILIMACATLIAYILGEGFTDVAHAKNNTEIQVEGIDEDA